MNENLDLGNLSTIPIAPEGFKSGFVGIIGRPNVGKSTLMNQLIGQKIAITSPVSQTTRNRLQGILTTDKAQIIFVDTPGIHKPHHTLGKIIVKNAKTAINSVDIILLVVDSSVKSGGGDRYIIDLLKTVNQPVILGLNKSDQQTEKYQEIDESYANLIQDHNWPMIKFSALTGDGVETLQNTLIEQLEPGPYYYPPDLITDQPERFIMAELIREQILQLTRQEVPHSVAVTIEKVEESPKITKIFAAINVERSSQKGIIIGQKGNMLKAIGTTAREQIQKLIAGEVFLKLFVKVEPQWRQSNLRLAEFGYRVEE
ncbi:GTP-binding protein [Crocosphaera subtropica ATCC 51142]|uniref:GTPase Era n=1 Tax=Crocosphaera subtropica (strain ATCC 51142 / BH68) TaxID=43989 RepID=ERA_CROS5|nr:GTPase Era [Crocosphaera subtropica]B1WT49.1 RecName: Full=GTPase Era [Crocosphaera subtropica ATCC 51142]ACB51971.1 GTP-binding protein [Crocosphaera subtropica ATCC 51142]